MQATQRYAVLLCAAATLTVTACRKPAPSDAILTVAVQTRMAADSALSSETIQTSAQTGIVTLTGSVSNDAARSLAANDAAAVPGVRTVVNNLTVGAVPPATAQLSPAPAATVDTAPTRVRTLPIKPSASVERQNIAPISPPPPPVSQPAPVERAAGTPDQPIPPPPAVPTPRPAFRNIDLSSGTAIPVRITQTLDSATNQQGDAFSGVVASDVLVDGAIVLPQGSVVSGRVDAVQEAAHFKGNSLLTVSLTSLSRRGDRIPISTEPYTKEGAGRGKNTAEKTGVGAAAGAILGGIFGGGKGAAIGAAAGGGAGAGVNGVTRGQQVQIPSETVVSFRLSNSVSVRVPTKDSDRQGDAPDSGRRPLP